MELVPFGEYVRSRGFSFRPQGRRGHRRVSRRHRARRIPDRARQVRDVDLLRGHLPRAHARFVAGGADFLVNITNDAWFGRTSAPYQHLAMVAVRAIENRVRWCA